MNREERGWREKWEVDRQKCKVGSVRDVSGLEGGGGGWGGGGDDVSACECVWVSACGCVCACRRVNVCVRRERQRWGGCAHQ